MKGLFKNLTMVVLILLLLSGTFALLGEGFGGAKRVPFSELVRLVQGGSVKSIYVEGSELRVTLVSGEELRSSKEEANSLVELFTLYGVSPEAIKNIQIEIRNATSFGFFFSTLLGTLLPLLIIGGFMYYLIRATSKRQMDAFGFIRSGAKPAAINEKTKITFKDVANLKEAKEELEDVVDFLKNPKKYTEIGAKIPRGALLIGSPGTGKTMLARAVAGEANVPFFHIAGSQFVELFVGVGSSRVRDLFQTAKKHAPALIFIDEIDAVGRQRGAGLGGGHDEREQTLNQILVEMDGFERDTGLVVLAATNRPDILDPALLRPGRFDRRVTLDLPDIKAREEILEIHARNKRLAKEVKLREVAERTPGFSGADLENILNEAAIIVAKDGRKELGQQDLLTAMEKVLLGPEKKSRVFSDQEKKIAAYHEAGHALVASFQPKSDPVRKVSIVSRGFAGGYTLKLPTEDKHYRSYSEFLAELAILMGGYSAEKFVFGEVTTGASNDLSKASELARDIVIEYGMSEELGPMTFGSGHQAIFLGREIVERRSFSEEIAAKIDKEVSRLIRHAFETAQKIIKEKRELLERIANRLLEKETIEGEELKELLA
ncbi:MAG: ATP-dependent zinc metalloprotease FtsH [Candidatus Portnoybacteria bacterium]|nr:ATP-dependent zinc metalloprotease FtsH [Candidatus Portnoybacteria bacterium]